MAQPSDEHKTAVATDASSVAPRDNYRVFLEITIGNTVEGRIELELFARDLPKTCENFRALCTGRVLANNVCWRVNLTRQDGLLVAGRSVRWCWCVSGITDVSRVWMTGEKGLGATTRKPLHYKK